MKGEATSRRREQVEAEFLAGGVWLNDETRSTHATLVPESSSQHR